jgi:hypothetical protein
VREVEKFVKEFSQFRNISNIKTVKTDRLEIFQWTMENIVTIKEGKEINQVKTLLKSKAEDISHIQ